MENDVVRWLWLVAAVVLLVGEMLTAGLFMLPFAIGAAVAAGLAFAGVDLVWQLVACLVVSLVAFLALRPLARRLDRTGITAGIGSRRLVDAQALVIETITVDDGGMVRIEGEEWRAVAGPGVEIPEGTFVRIEDVEGTRVRVVPEGEAT